MISKRRFKDDNQEEYVLFRKVAPHLDEAEGTVAREILKHVQGNKKVKYLSVDLGCGTGLTLKSVLELSKNIYITGVDNEPNMIKQSKKIFKGNSLLKFQCIDILGYLKKSKGNSLDIVFSAEVLHNCKNSYRNLVYKEIHRVLKPSGIFVNMDKYAKDNQIEHERDLDWQLRMFKIFDKYNHPELTKKWTKHYLQDENKSLIMYENKFKQKLAELNFKNIRKVYRKRMEATYTAVKR